MSTRLLMFLAMAFLVASAVFALTRGAVSTSSSHAHRREIEERIRNLKEVLQEDDFTMIRQSHLDILTRAIEEFDALDRGYDDALYGDVREASRWLTRQGGPYPSFAGQPVELYVELANDLILEGMALGVASIQEHLPLRDREELVDNNTLQNEVELYRLLFYQRVLRAMDRAGVSSLVRLEPIGKTADRPYGADYDLYPVRITISAEATAAVAFLEHLVASSVHRPAFDFEAVLFERREPDEWRLDLQSFEAPPVLLDVTVNLVLPAPL